MSAPIAWACRRRDASRRYAIAKLAPFTLRQWLRSMRRALMLGRTSDTPIAARRAIGAGSGAQKSPAKLHNFLHSPRLWRLLTESLSDSSIQSGEVNAELR